MSVLVVGAGPVGLTLANLLGAAGVETTLIEANEGLSDSPRAILIDDESFRTFQAIGLADAVRAAVVYGTGARYYAADGGLLATVRPGVGAFGFPKRSAFGQPALERLLLAGLRRFARVRVRFGARLTAANTSGAVTIEEGRARLERYDWVVGCDGGRSFVRAALGARMTGSSFTERWLILDTLNDPDDSRYTKFFCDPRRPAVSVPAPQGGRRYEFMLLPGEEPADLLAPAMIARLMAGRRALAAADIARQTVYTFHALIADRWRAGALLIAGDAAHMMPPFAGQGMNSGIRDAANLAWKLAAVSRGVAGAGLLDSYEAERRAHAAAMIALSVRLGRIVMATSRRRALARDALFRLLGLIPPARAYIASMRWKPAPRATAGAFVEPGRGLIGAMLPQPMMAIGDGASAPLDVALGDGFSLVSADADPATLADPLWDRLAARRARVLTGDRTPRRAGEVGDIGDTLARALKAHRGEVLLVRPDRYVAGAFRPADEAVFARRFAALLGAPAATVQSTEPAREAA